MSRWSGGRWRGSSEGPTWASVATGIALIAAALAIGLSFGPQK